MKGFIEVTRNQNNETRKVLVSVASIKFMEMDNGETCIILFGSTQKRKGKPWDASGVSVKESYSEVLAKIKEATE